MNGVSRTFLGLYSLLWIAACTGLVVMAWNSDQKLDIVAGELNIQAFIDATDSVRLAFTGMMFALALIGVITFLLAVTPASNAKGQTLRVRQSDGTETTISAANIESALRAELETFPDITKADVKLDVRNQRVYTSVDVSLVPDASVGYVTALVNEVVISLLRDRAGIGAYAPPQVHTRFETAARSVRTSSAPQQAMALQDQFDEQPLPQIEWEAPETRTPRRDRLSWNPPAPYSPPGGRDE